MKAIIVFCIFLMAIPVFAGTWRDDFENEQDFIDDCKNEVWILEVDDNLIVRWENGSIKVEDKVEWQHGGGLAIGNEAWKDYTVECKVKQLKINFLGSGILLRHRYLNSGTAYFFSIKDNEAGIYPYFSSSSVDSSPFQPELGKWYTLKAVAHGNQFEFYVDGKLVAKAEHDQIQSGYIGFGSFGTALFDDFVMTGPDIQDGGHWNPKAHDQLSSLEPKNKLTSTWGKLKSDN